MTLDHSTTKYVTFAYCEQHDHFLAGVLFWVMISVIAFSVAGAIYTASPAYVQERQELDAKWKFIQNLAGCNDLKYELDEILVLREKERTLEQKRMVEYLKERVAWTCSSEARGTSD